MNECNGNRVLQAIRWNQASEDCQEQKGIDFRNSCFLIWSCQFVKHLVFYIMKWLFRRDDSCIYSYSFLQNNILIVMIFIVLISQLFGKKPFLWFAVQHKLCSFQFQTNLYFYLFLSCCWFIFLGNNLISSSCFPW